MVVLIIVDVQLIVSMIVQRFFNQKITKISYSEKIFFYKLTYFLFCFLYEKEFKKLSLSCYKAESI